MLLAPRTAVPPRLIEPHPAALPAALYLLLGAADLFFSLVAFSHGVPEGNPFMAWLLGRGMFVPGKIAVTLLVAGLMLAVYRRSCPGRWVVWGGVGLMAGVVVFHLWALSHLVRHAPLIAVS